MTSNRRQPEQELYGPIRKWLLELLCARHPRAKTHVLDTSRRSLSSIIEEHTWSAQFGDWQTYEVHVDLAGFVFFKRHCKVYLVEIKSGPITLRDLGQLMGYCKVVRPALGLIVSPQGLSSAMSMLLQVYGRYDLLDFGGASPIVIGTWQESKCDLDYASVIPKGTVLA